MNRMKNKRKAHAEIVVKEEESNDSTDEEVFKESASKNMKKGKVSKRKAPKDISDEENGVGDSDDHSNRLSKKHKKKAKKVKKEKHISENDDSSDDDAKVKSESKKMVTEAYDEYGDDGDGPGLALDDLLEGGSLFEDVEMEQEEEEDKNIVWPKETLETLIDRALEHTSENDNMKYSSRVSKLRWNAIKFDEYDEKACKNMLKSIFQKTRCHRTLREVLLDAKRGVTSSYASLYKTKHPDMPTKPLSSYMLFHMDIKPKIVEDFDGIKCPEISKKVSQMWKEDENIQQKYKKKSQELLEKYHKKLQEFYKKHPEFMDDKKKRGKANEDSLGFDKPRSAFNIFYHEMRDSNINFENASGLHEKAKRDWKNLPEPEKLLYIEKAKKEDEAYKKKLDKYKKEHPGKVVPVHKSILTKSDRQIMENKSGKPKKPPSNVYSLFSQTMLQSGVLKNITSKDRLHEISKKWKGMSDGEKEVYNQQLQMMINTYNEEFKEYLEKLPPDEKEKEQLIYYKKSDKKPTNKRFMPEPEDPIDDPFKYYCFKTKSDENKDATKRKWLSLPDATQKNYIREMLQDLNTYVDEYTIYLQTVGNAAFKICFNKLSGYRQKTIQIAEDLAE